MIITRPLSDHSVATKWPSLGHSGATTGSPNDHCVVTAQPSSHHCWGHSRRCCRALAQPFQPQLQFSTPCSQGAPRGPPVVLQALLLPFPQDLTPCRCQGPLAQEGILPPQLHSCLATPGLAWLAPLAHANASTTCAWGHRPLDTWFPAQVEALGTPSTRGTAQECSQSSGLPAQGSFGIRPLTGRAGTCPRV